MSYKQTEILTVDNRLLEGDISPEIDQAAKWLREGEVVAFPTETVYGLGANALDEQAIQKIFIAKGRPSDNPLIVHIASKEQLPELVTEIPTVANALIESFWPGPLTIIFKRAEGIAPGVTAGLSTVAVRVPDHPVAIRLLKKAGVPIAAPSANVSGKPSPTTAAHVFHDLTKKIIGIVDGGPTGVGLESTVIDCSGDTPILYRPGGVTKEQLEEVIGPIEVDPSLSSSKEAPRSPGMKYTHYSPNGRLYLVSDHSNIQSYIKEAKKAGSKVGVLTTEEDQANYEADVVLSSGTRTDLATIANGLYSSLRLFDQEKVEIIFAETFPKEGLGIAIMNRLEKAAEPERLK